MSKVVHFYGAGLNSPDELTNGGLYQVHVVQLSGGCKLVLYPVELHRDERCPVILQGEGSRERCGLPAGHEGKHMWGGGD